MARIQEQGARIKGCDIHVNRRPQQWIPESRFACPMTAISKVMPDHVRHPYSFSKSLMDLRISHRSPEDDKENAYFSALFTS